MANGNLYLVPALLLLIWLVSVLKNNEVSFSVNAIQPVAWFAGALMALLTPALWLPLLRGYPDGGGLVFCFLVMALFVRWQQKQRSITDDRACLAGYRRAARWLGVFSTLVFVLDIMVLDFGGDALSLGCLRSKAEWLAMAGDFPPTSWCRAAEPLRLPR